MAKSVDEKDFEKAVEKEIETGIKSWIDKNFGKEGKIIGEFISIGITVFMIWAAHNVLSWNYPIFDFVKDNFTSVLWIIDLALGVSVFTKMMKILIPNEINISLMNIIDNIFSFILTANLLQVFPYDFQKLINIVWINSAMQFVFIIALFGVFVATIVEFVKLLKNLMK